MGSIFRQQYYVTVRGKRVKRESKKWYIQWKRADGTTVRAPAYTDRAASLQMLARKEREAALQIEGMIDATTTQLSRPIAEHIADFVQHLADKKRAEDYRDTTETRITRICEFGKITTAPELTQSRVDSALAAFSDPTKWDKPFSAATRNQYLTAIKGFAQWLVGERRLADNPIARMEKLSTDGEETMIRRPLTPAELSATIQATVDGPPRLRIRGPDRAALYVLASQTGFRRREMSRVTPSSFTFGEEPEVKLPGKATKNKKRAGIELRRDVAAFFQAYLTGKPDSEPVWRLTKNAHTATMIRADMDAAGVKWRDGIEVADFHSLRETYVTELALAGVVPKVLQQLARHSTSDLTMNKYAKPRQEHRRAAVESTPAPAYLTQPLTQAGETHGNSQKSNSASKQKRRTRKPNAAKCRKSRQKR
jgi:integrase